MPANKERRAAVLERKRKEYFNFVRDYYDKERQGMHKETFHQVIMFILVETFGIEVRHNTEFECNSSTREAYLYCCSSFVNCFLLSI